MTQLQHSLIFFVPVILFCMVNNVCCLVQFNQIDIVRIIDCLEFLPGPFPCERIDERIFSFIYSQRFHHSTKYFEKETDRAKQSRCRAVIAEIGTINNVK